MNREVHVRIWESPEVKFLRATRPSRPSWRVAGLVAIGPTADIGPGVQNDAVDPFRK